MEPLAAKPSTHIADQYSEIAHTLELYPSFYSFIGNACQSYGISADASMIDVGCGSGRLMRELFDRGYNQVAGADFSPGCVALAQRNCPTADIRLHDIQERPLWTRFDVIFLTEVIEHLTDPIAGLKNLRASLAPTGRLFLTFPNRLAFFPGYYLRPLVEGLRPWNWLYERIGWFTLPYEMRSQQPVDHAYAPRDVAAFLLQANFEVVDVQGMRLLPMLRLPSRPWTDRLMTVIEQVTRGHLPVSVYYRYMMICKARN